MWRVGLAIALDETDEVVEGILDVESILEGIDALLDEEMALLLLEA